MSRSRVVQLVMFALTFGAIASLVSSLLLQVTRAQTLFEDEFDRSELGADWESITGSWSVDGDLSGSDAALVLATSFAATPNMTLQADVLGNFADRLVFRYIDSDNFLYIAPRNVGGTYYYSLYKRVSGIDTFVEYNGNALLGPMTLQVVANGDSITWGDTSTFLQTITESTHNTGLRLGLACTVSTCAYDNVLIFAMEVALTPTATGVPSPTATPFPPRRPPHPTPCRPRKHTERMCSRP